MLKKIIPHICVILSLMMLTFFVVDKYNPGMNFVGNDAFKILLAIYGVTVLISSAYLIAYNRRS